MRKSSRSNTTSSSPSTKRNGPSDWLEKADDLKRQYSNAVDVLDKEEDLLEQYQESVEAAKEARAIVTGIAEAVQQQAHSHIVSVVTSALQTVFDDPYTFHIRFERKRNRTEAVLEFVRDECVVDPLSAAGGGVVDVAAFALRVACLVLSTPKLRPLMVLDEPFKFVSEEYRDKIGELILGLSDRMGVQFIMVTHIEELKIGKVIEL